MEFSKSPIIRQLQRRLLIENRSVNCVLCGQPGSGKSWGGLTLAKMIDPTFDESRICFSVRQFFELMTTADLKKGQAILLEEGGVLMSNRQAMSQLNQAIAQTAQVMRHRNLLLIITTPSLAWIDLQVRSLIQLYLECIGVDYRAERVIAKPLWLQPNYRMNTIYWHSPRYMSKRGPIVVSTLRIPKPPNDLVEKYEEAKKRFTSALFARGLDTSTKAEAGISTPSYRQLVDEIIASKHQHTNAQGKISMSRVAMAYNFGDKKTRSIKSMLKAMGEEVDS